MATIYLAAPLTTKEDRERNATLAGKLRAKGLKVLLPQEFGVIPQGNRDDSLRKQVLKQDIEAMDEADICVGYMDREKGVSEGMIFEMGYMYAQRKKVIFFNPHDKYRYGSMLAYATEIVETEEECINRAMSLSA